MPETAQDLPEGSDAATVGKAGRAPLVLHMPVDVRSVSLAFLALVAGLFAMQWAREILIPILFGIMMSYSLTPIVNHLEKWRVPRAAGATFLLTAIIAALAWGVWSLSDEVDALTDTLPQITQKIRQLSQPKRGTVSTIEKVQQAATELAAAANEGASPASGAVPAPLTAAAPERPTSAARTSAASPIGPASQQGSAPAAGLSTHRPQIDVRGYVLSGTIGALAVMGQVAVVFFIALFLMASGNSFRRKMVKLAGPKLSQKKVTIETLDEITDQIQRYLLVQLGVSVIVGIATWMAFFAIGMNQSAVWGVVAGVTNLIPYLGAILVGGGSAVVGLVQFGTVEMALLVGGSSFVVHTLIGNLLTPWWMGRASKMSPIAVFVAVLVFGWLWGVAGLLLGVPILMVAKTICDRIEDLKPIGELLGA